MKGVVLAGGSGTRLRPLTLVTNKHLLPVYDRPMIHYPIRTLVRAGIRDILVVTGGEHAEQFHRLLGTGAHLGVANLEYAPQEGHGGVADALRLARGFADGGPICVVLGDNIFQEDLRSVVEDFAVRPAGARLLLKTVTDPERFGVCRFHGRPGTSRIAEILEKPAHPPSRYVVTGCYLYDDRVFDMCDSLRPSDRGELEITDVNNLYLRRGDLTYDLLDGWWADAGTFESLHRAACLVARDRRTRPFSPTVLSSRRAPGSPRAGGLGVTRFAAGPVGTGR